jgi:DNA-binding transcriptional ArsR family regulator
VSIDIASLILNYTVIPFVSAIGLSILALQIYNQLKNKKFKKYNIEIKISQLESQLKDQINKTDLISEQFRVLYDRSNKTNEKLTDIQRLIKLLDENIIFYNNKIKSQTSVISPFQNYVSNPKIETSQPSHDIISQRSINSVEQGEDHQNSTIEYILKKLEDKSMTTREVQTVIGRTREHTSRLMKKLFEEKLVDRDVSTKPFRYAITVEGRKLLSKHSASKSHSHLDLANNENPLNELIEK